MTNRLLGVIRQQFFAEIATSSLASAQRAVNEHHVMHLKIVRVPLRVARMRGILYSAVLVELVHDSSMAIMTTHDRCSKC